MAYQGGGLPLFVEKLEGNDKRDSLNVPKWCYVQYNGLLRIVGFPLAQAKSIMNRSFSIPIAHSIPRLFYGKAFRGIYFSLTLTTGSCKLIHPQRGICVCLTAPELSIPVWKHKGRTTGRLGDAKWKLDTMRNLCIYVFLCKCYSFRSKSVYFPSGV